MELAGYKRLESLGQGSFGTVWKAVHQKTGRIVAIKELGFNTLTEPFLKQEIAIMKSTEHPNIVRLYDSFRSKETRTVYLVLEFCDGGDLQELIQRKGKIGTELIRTVLRQLAAALQVLRKKNLVHRDLKPHNLLLSWQDGELVLKLADFGFARRIEPECAAGTICGTYAYMAPEVFAQHKYDAKADLWSVGAVLYQMVTGEPPFGIKGQSLEKNRNEKVKFLPQHGWDPKCLDLCRKLLRKNPVERISFEEFFSHEFLRESGHLKEGKVEGHSHRELSQFKLTTEELRSLHS